MPNGRILRRGWPRSANVTMAEKFGHKVWLLIIDKIVIGAVIALAIFLYDGYKTKNEREYRDLQAQTLLRIERSTLLKEFLPIIQDNNRDLVTRGYVLRSAVVVGALDADAAFEIGQDFLRLGLSANHYQRILPEMLPDGIGAFSRRGVQIAIDWYDRFEYFPNLDVVFDPWSGSEHLPEGVDFVTEGRILREVLYDNLHKFEDCDCPELYMEHQIPNYLYGLFVLLKTTDRRRAEELSRNDKEALRLLGMVIRMLQSDADGDRVAEKYVEDEFRNAGLTNERGRRADVLLAIMRWASNRSQGLGSAGFTNLLAKVAVGELPEADDGSYYRLQWDAAEALLLAEDGAAEASDEIVFFLESFRQKLTGDLSGDQLHRLSREYVSGKVVRVLVDVLSNISTDYSDQVLRGILELEDEKLQYFPFLREGVERALNEVQVGRETPPN